MVAGAVLLLALGGAAFAFFRRRTAKGEGDALMVSDDAAPLSVPVPAVTSTQPLPVEDDAPRARLAIAYRPLRAGLNLLSATVESDVVVTNIGDAPAEAIRADIRLLGAHTGLETDLAALRAAPIGRPVVPPFALAPGEERRIAAVAALPRDAIPSLSAGGRPMFVPIVSLNLLCQTDGRPAQSAQAFAVGIERVDSAKLAPLWLDTPPRMHDHVAARPHGAEIERFG